MISANTLMDRLVMLGTEPRWHGNGFIQLPLNEDTQIHVWGPATKPLPENNSRIHNHVWGLDSNVIMGVVGHKTFDVGFETELSLNTHVVYNADENGLHETPGRRRVALANTYRFATGSQYLFAPGKFHESFADNAMSIMRKSRHDPMRTKPHVLVPIGEEPYDAHGDDRLTENQMWSVIYSALPLTDQWGRWQLMSLLEKLEK